MKIFVDVLWGYHVLGLILLTGIRLSVSTGFFQIRKFFSWVKYSLCPPKPASKSGISRFGALSAALAGSIGTGNIVGVAAAITVGGAGAIFWMWISSVFGMMTVFAEVALAAKYKNHNAKGAFAYIEKVGKGKILPFIYGAGCVLSSLSMGNMAQSNAVATGLNQFGVPMAATGAVLCVVLFVLTKRGLQGVTKVTEKLVPFMTLLFFGVSAICLVKFRHNILPALNEILESAFTLRAGAGGGLFIAVKTGISRGVFTNEAGLGSSSMAFCEVEDSPVRLGYMGIFQVFVDTIVMCLVTAMCILCSTELRQGEYLVITAFQNGLGEWGKTIITVCMILFAFATMTATCYYGRTGLDYISKGKLTFLFPYLFGACAFLGSVMNITGIFDFCDAFNGLMAIPNLIALALFSGEIKGIIQSENRLKAPAKGRAASGRKAAGGFKKGEKGFLSPGRPQHPPRKHPQVYFKKI